MVRLVLFQVSLNVLDNSIEIMHISMSLDNNNMDIYIRCSATEPFLICIPSLQRKLVGMIDGTLYIDYPGRLLQTINTRNFKVK